VSAEAPVQAATPEGYTADSRVTVLAANLVQVELSRGRVLWYSYGVPIAIRQSAWGDVFTCDGDWSKTTAKHRGMIEREYGRARLIPSEFSITVESL
jgi:hypothetical protein